MIPDSQTVNGIQIGTHSIKEIVLRVDAFLRHNKNGIFHIANLNPETFIIALEQPVFKKILNSAEEKLIDGIGIKILADMRGIGSGEKMAGTDLVAVLVDYASRHGKKVFFLGGAGKTAEKTRDYFRTMHPKLLAVADSGANDVAAEKPEEKKRVLDLIRKERPDFVFVAYGPPKQEQWIAGNKEHLDGIVCMGVGGSFNFFSGTVPRAPFWVSKYGMEWVWRFAMEPARFLRKIGRYLKFWGFLLLTAASRFDGYGRRVIASVAGKIVSTAKFEPVAFLLAIIILLIRLPPFNPPLGNSVWLLSTNIARALIVIGVLLLVLRRAPLRLNNPGVYLALLFFLSQSFSIVRAVNIESFLLSYKNLLFSILLYPIAYYAFSKKNKNVLLTAFLIATALSLVFELAVYFLPSFADTFIKPFMYDSYWQFLDFQISRNRFFGDSFEEVLIPVLTFVLFFDKKKLSRLLSILLIPTILLMTLVSNWRTKFILFLAASLGSLIIYRGWLKKYIPFIILSAGIIVLVGSQISLQTVGSNLFNRFFNEADGPLTVSTTESRFIYWREALQMGLSNPLTGVGMGNFYDNLSARSQSNKVSGTLDVAGRFVTIDDPHDIFISTFAYSGLFGLGALLLLLGYFAVSDLSAILKKNYLLRSLTVSFWSLFLFSVLNPSASFSYLGLFWVLRGFIEKTKEENISA